MGRDGFIWGSSHRPGLISSISALTARDTPVFDDPARREHVRGLRCRRFGRRVPHEQGLLVAAVITSTGAVLRWPPFSYCGGHGRQPPDGHAARTEFDVPCSRLHGR